MTNSAGKLCQLLMVASFVVLQTWPLHAQETAAEGEAAGPTFEIPKIGAKGYHVGDYLIQRGGAVLACRARAPKVL